MTNTLSNLRNDALQASSASLDAQRELTDASAILNRARLTGEGNIDAAQATVEQAKASATAALEQAALRRGALKDAISAAVGAQVAAQIAPANMPVALLPVGLETRFDGDTLLVRVIPDQIHVEDHEPQLSDAEVEAGRGFWRSVWRGGTTEPAATEAELSAWAVLVAGVGSARRASWIAETTAPVSEGADRPALPLAADQPLPEPPFPEPPRRPGGWSQPATARTLPDRFVAIAYRRDGSGGDAAWTELGRVQGGPVDDSVQLGFDPHAPAPALDDTGPALPDGMRWMTDVSAAEQAGLLLRLPLPAGTQEVHRLVVLGVLTTLDPEASAQRLADLLIGHHHSSGLEIVPIGTPTNNTAEDTSGYARRDDLLTSFTTERRTAAPPDGSDGALLARALGIPANALRGVAHSHDAEQAMAGQVNALVWPSAMGYWLESLIQPGPSDEVIADLRQHAVQMVRGRGPLPPLRIGRQPYGVLPVTSLAGWQPLHDPPGVVQLVHILRQVRPWWQSGVSHAPVVRAGADPDQGMLDVLSQLPVSTTVGVRSMVGSNACYVPNYLGAGGAALAAEANRQFWLSVMAFEALGIKSSIPHISGLVAAADPTPLLRLPYTVDPRLNSDQRRSAWATEVTYLRSLRHRGTTNFRAENPRQLSSLLSLLARRSVMLERLRAGLHETKGVVAGQFAEAHLRTDEAAVVAATLIPTTATLRIGQVASVATEILSGSVVQPDGSARPMLEFLDARLVLGLDPVMSPEYAATVQAVEAVSTLTPDRAALLLGEALDVASHRLDAWITSLATRRLSDLRAGTPVGVTLGAYGAVEDLKRRTARQAVETPPGGAPVPLFTDPASGGYIHAPSLPQAATAAVLRAGHLSHAERDPHSAALALDLTSARVRAALGLLDGVREGQSLGALLGYRAERQLHDLGAHTAVEVVRRLAPPPVVTSSGTPEGLPPRAVCDGLALSRLDLDAVLASVTEAGADAEAVRVTLGAISDSVDSVADLLLAESVHQVVRGNPERAAAALDTLNRGEGATAEPDVVRTPRAGTGLTQRVLIVLGAEVPAAPGWPADGIRARAEPRVAAWAGHLLGDVAGIDLTVRRDGHDLVTFPLSDLGLGALDLIYEPQTARALRHARSLGAPDGAALDLTTGPLAGLLAMADLLRDLLTRARAGSGLDLARPQDRGGVVTGPAPRGSAAAETLITSLPDVDHGERRTRLDAARTRLQEALDALPKLAPEDPVPDEATYAQALNDLAAFGLVPGGDPTRRPETLTLIAFRAAVAAQLERATAAPDDSVSHFGEGFPVLALAAPPFPTAVSAALSIDPVASVPEALLAPEGGAAQALTSWLETVGRVRPAVGRLADVLLAARLRQTDEAASLRAMQLPTEPFPDAPPELRGQWVGFGFPAPLTPEPVTSFVLHALGAVDVVNGVALLVVDDYTEFVPAATATTAVSFNFDAPGARPPQTVLLAVPPVADTPWSVDALADVIAETLDLARIRMVDLSAVAWAGRFLPTLYLTDGDVASGVDLPMKDIVTLANNVHMAFQP